MPRHPGCKDQCFGSFLCRTFALSSSCPVQKAACRCALFSIVAYPMVVHYFITLQPAAAGCVTCNSLLICSSTRYSVSALLHLIRTGCVPPNNGIMTGTGWFLVLVLSAFWPRAISLERQLVLTQMWHSYSMSATACSWCPLVIHITSLVLEGLWISWCFNC